jgi:hypothetical protein
MLEYATKDNLNNKPNMIDYFGLSKTFINFYILINNI